MCAANIIPLTLALLLLYPAVSRFQLFFLKSVTTRVCACHRICLFAAKTIHVQTGSATGGALHENIQQGLRPHFHALAQSFTLLK